MTDNLNEKELDVVDGGFGEKTGKTYIVKKGDTLHSIAEKFGVTTAVLAAYNARVLVETARENGENPTNVLAIGDHVYEGEELQIP